MRNYENNYASSFEQEFAPDNEFDTEAENDFESENNYENDFETENEFDTEAEAEIENEYDNESEFDNEDEFDSEFSNEFDNEFSMETDSESYYTNRLSELFSQNYENDFQFEQDYNGIMHEMERDYFWGGLKKLAKKGIAYGLKNLPIDQKYKSMLAGLAKGQLPSMASLIKTLGPKMAQFIPGIGPIASTAMGAMMNSEVNNQNKANQAARNTVALAKQSYSNYANAVANKMASNTNINQVRSQLPIMAQNAIKNAHNTIRLGSNASGYKRVSRKVSNVTVKGRPYKKVVIYYQKR